jgi:hypothetical protein
MRRIVNPGFQAARSAVRDMHVLAPGFAQFNLFVFNGRKSLRDMHVPAPSLAWVSKGKLSQDILMPVRLAVLDST